MADPFAFPSAFATSDPFASHGGGGRRRTAAYPPLPEAETESAIHGLTGTALSGLGYVGSELDKLFGGRAIRAGVNAGLNALQGKGALGDLRDVLSVIPGTDVTGITDINDSVSGNQVLRNLGEGLGTNLDPETSDNWAVKHLAGPAVEMSLDPSMYFGGIGALTRAGKVASKTGQLTKGLIPGVRAGEKSFHPVVAALSKAGVPGLEGPALADKLQFAAGLGGKAASGLNVGVRRLPVVGDLAGAAIDATGAGLKQANLVRRSLFDTKAGRVANEPMQRANEFVRVPAEREAMVAAREAGVDLGEGLKPLLDAGVDPIEISRHLTRMGQGAQLPGSAAPSMSNVMPAALAGTLGDIRRLLDPLPELERAEGIASSKVASDYERQYMLGRVAKATGSKGASRGTQPFSPFNSSQIRKKSIFDLPGGQDQLEHEFIRNPLLSGEGRTAAINDQLAQAGIAPLSVKEASRAVRDRILAEHMRVPMQATAGTFPINFPKTAARKSGGLARYLAKVKPEHIGPDAEPFFNPDVLGNVQERLRRSAESVGKAKAVANVIGQVGVRGKLAEGVPATEAMWKAGLRGEGGYEQVLRQLGEDPDALIAAANQVPRAPADPIKVMRDVLKRYSLPGEDASALTSYMNPWKPPVEWAPVLDRVDSFNRKFRDLTYSLWPASWGRNWLSGVEENAMEGTAPWSGAYKTSDAIRRGDGVVSGFPGHAPLSPEAQRVGVMREAIGQGVIGGRAQGQAGELAPGIPQIPTAVRESIPSMMKRFRPGSMVETGKEVSAAVEEKLRLSEFVDLRRKGFSAEDAAQRVSANHFDYHDTTPFENAVMKRLIPFYTFPSRNLPKQVRRAVAEPAKISAPMRLAGNTRGDEDQYVPEYLQSGLAIPVGDEADGTQRYLSQLGLPMEEAFSRLKVGKSLPDTLARTLMAAAGTLGPIPKGVLEGMTGKQFYTGRDMADLHVGKVESGLGLLDDEHARVVAQAVSASPGTRMLSTLNKLLDERKYTPTGLAGLGLGFTTGTKLTDVDTDKWRAIDARHNLENLMHGSPGIRQSTDYYPTPEAKASGAITPQQAYWLQVYAGMKQKAREAAKEKRRLGVQVGGP